MLSHCGRWDWPIEARFEARIRAELAMARARRQWPCFTMSAVVMGSCFRRNDSGALQREPPWIASLAHSTLSSRTSERKQARSGTHTPRLLDGHKWQIRYTTTSAGGYGFLLSQEQHKYSQGRHK